MTKITILGCGVIGLYTTYLLLEKGYDAKDITIIAKHIPGDFSHEYASPYAGATINTAKSEDELIKFFYKFTYEKLKQMRDKFGGKNCGIGDVYNTESWSKKPSDESLDFFKAYNKTCEELSFKELPEGAEYGHRYKSFVVNPPLLIKFLFDYVKGKGVKVVLKKVDHIKDAILEDTKMLFNCSGAGAKTLGGVKDFNCHPTRAQVVVIKAPHIQDVRLFWGKDANYMIKRPYSNHEVVLGGFYQKGNDNRDVLGFETQDILKRACKHFPVLKPGQSMDDIEILRVVSAFRPGRTGGVRIEKEIINGTNVVHNYGAEGSGFAQGLGMAEKAINTAFSLSKL